MRMAYWHGMSWGVSSKEIAFLEDLSTEYSLNTETNTDKEGKKKTEKIGANLIEFSMHTTYRVETGTRDVRHKIDQWNALVGKSGPLILGKHTFGPHDMQLQSVGLSNISLTAEGVMRAATLEFKFKESTTGKKSRYKPNTSAVYVRPSKETKKNKKTVSRKTLAKKKAASKSKKKK